MAAPDTSIAVPRDDLDDLYDYNVNNADDAFRDFNANMDAPIRGDKSRTATARMTGTDLGIDNEVQIVKKRKPIPKLDEKTLLSQPGIPKLKRIAKERLRFKGKGHEFSDVARLLNLYQLWLDDLYPRAKFADGLAIIEKLGHTKEIQTRRREWIKDGNPRDKEDKQAPNDKTSLGSVQYSLSHTSNDYDKTENLSMTNDDDLYDATPEPQDISRGKQKGSSIHGDSLFLSDNHDGAYPPEDDLDALLAEDAQKETNSNHNDVKQSIHTSSSWKTAPPDENFEDEMEVMAGMDDTW